MFFPLPRGTSRKAAGDGSKPKPPFPRRDISMFRGSAGVPPALAGILPASKTASDPKRQIIYRRPTERLRNRHPVGSEAKPPFQLRDISMFRGSAGVPPALAGILPASKTASDPKRRTPRNPHWPGGPAARFCPEDQPRDLARRASPKVAGGESPRFHGYAARPRRGAGTRPDPPTSR
jgi:hypothetical protein